MDFSQEIKFIVLILSMSSFIELEAEIDCYYIRKTFGLLDTGVPHGKNAIQRCIVYFSLLTLYFGVIDIRTVLWFLFSMSAWWIVFDIRVNIKNLSMSIFYVGKTALTDKKIRKISKKLGLRPETTMIYSKILLLIITTALVII